MLWYEALVPAAIIAIAVRLEALVLLPYWSWLQLIPELGTPESPLERKKKNRALARRISIPLLVGLLLTALWPAIYAPSEVLVVSALGAGLLLWPLLFAHYYDEVRSPPWLAWVLYALMLLLFATSGFLGSIFGTAINDAGGFLPYLSDELMSWLLTGIALLFVSALFDRVSTTLARNREKEVDEWESGEL